MKIFNSQTYIRYSGFFMLLIATIGLSCKKSPIDNVKLIIDPNVIKYSMLLDIRDAANSTVRPQNINISFSGADADNIYEISGAKKFKVVDGKLNIGLGPNRIPTASSPASFEVTISAEGYMPVTKSLNITAVQKAQVVNLNLINLSSPPTGMQISQQAISLVNGAITGETFITVSNSGLEKRVMSTQNQEINPSLKQTFTQGQTNVVLPEGTTFYYTESVQTGEVITINKEEITEKTPIPLDPGNGTAYWYRPTGQYKIDTIKTPVYTIVKKPVSSDKVTLVTLSYVNDPSATCSVYPYSIYEPFQVSILKGENVPEDRLLMKSAVPNKKMRISQILFTAKVPDKRGVMVTTTVLPNDRFNCYTSFVLDPATVNPITGNTIKAGDLIETGIDVAARTTLREPIFEATTTSGGKELRVNTQTTDAGYYGRATYTAEYNFNFGSAYTGPAVADPENLEGDVYLSFETGGKILPGYGITLRPNTPNVNLKGIVRSFDPIKLSNSYMVRYWGQSYSKTITASTGTFEVFELASQIKFEPTVTFEVTNECSSKNRVYTTNAYGTVNAAGEALNWGYAYITGGKWATNGLKQGKTYTSSIVVNGYTAHTTTLIDKQNFVQKYVNEFNVCNMF